ncbi:Ig-like domain-containing protein, partial [Haloferula sp.]|uniref:Ig-like domain-containing protein n=1 Tax=Haloferula sp. TaxID=2497595 RepID=UPI003C758DCB
STWVHQELADTRPPAVGFHLPQDGQTNYPVSAPISLLIHEVLETRTIINGDTILIRPVGGASLAAQFTLSFDGVLTFTPDDPLQENTSYEVVLDGIQDASGNAMEPYSFTFSTGETVSGNTAPIVESFTADQTVVEPGALITLTAVASDDNDPALDLEFRFDPGNGEAKTEWSPNSSVGFIYNVAGHYQPTVQVRDTAGAISSLNTGINIMTLPVGPAATSSGPVAIDTANRRIWTVNPDNNSVTVVHADDLTVIAEVPVGNDPRSVAIDPSGHAWITCHDDDRVVVLDGTSHAEIADFDTGHGSAPFGVVISPDGQAAYVSLYGSGGLMRFEVASLSLDGSPLELGHSARALAVSSDGSRVLVTRFISPVNHAEVWEVETAGFSLNRTLRIPKFGNSTHRDSTANSRGVANYLASILYAPDGESAWVAATKQNTERGTLFNAPQTHESTQRNLLVQIDLDPALPAGAVQRDIDLDNSDSASGLGLSPRGDYLFVTLQGNNQYLAFDLLELGSTSGLGAMVLRRNVGAAPQGVVVDPLTERIIVRNFLDRSLSVVDGAPLFETGGINLPSSTVSTVVSELLPTEVLAGKRIFYHADPRMSSESYISCASCHIDGGSDGRVWDFTQRGEGLRNTPDLRGRGGMAHGNVHWSGNFDEIQDFENDIRNFFGGTGFLTDEQFDTTSDPLGTSKAGLSADLDALAAYVTSLGNDHLPRSPHRAYNGSLTASAELGRQVFISMDCTSCHSGDDLTDSTSGLFHDVGTMRTTSGQRLGAPLTGIDTPTLRGLWSNAPYFHDGSARTLEDVFTIAGGTTYQAETGNVTGGVMQANPQGVYVNYDNTVMGGFAQLESGGLLTLEDIEGGSDGIGAVEIRYSSTSNGPAFIRVNGVTHPVVLTATGNWPAWRTTFWSNLRVEGVDLVAGPNNLIEIGGNTSRLGIDHITVSTAADLTAAAPHRSVPTEERDELIAYLLSLDDSPVSFSMEDAPAATLGAIDAEGAIFDAPFIDIDITFSAAITGLSVDDFQIGGTAGGSHSHLSVIADTTAYRLRIAGFSNPGELTVQLPADAVTSIADGTGNLASAALVLTYEPPVADDIAPLSDEFNDPTTLASWQRNDTAEGWNADKLEAWDIDTTTPGHMHLMPFASSWYQDFTGAYAYKEVTGDFVVTINLDALHRSGAGRPDSEFSLAGIMVRASRGLTTAAPVPAQPANTVLPWPPSGYTTDWQPDTENYIFLSYGHGANWLTSPDANNPNRWHYEVKTTTNGTSILYPRTHGVPENEPNATLQIVRRSSTFLLLRRHGAGPWIIENRFERTDLPQTLQVGITTYTDWATVSAGWTEDNINLPFHQNRIVNTTVGNPDLIANVDFFRLRRPDPSVDQAALQAALVTGQSASDGVIELSGNPALAPYLGDPAAAAVETPGQSYAQWLGEHFTPEQLVDPETTGPDQDPDQDRLPNLIDYLTEGDPWVDSDGLQVSQDEGQTQLLVARNTNVSGYRLVVEASSDLENWEMLAESVNGAPPSGPGFVSETDGIVRIMTIIDPVISEDTRFYRLGGISE